MKHHATNGVIDIYKYIESERGGESALYIGSPFSIDVALVLPISCNIAKSNESSSDMETWVSEAGFKDRDN